MSQRYTNKPFGGRWKPLELSGLFLFHPEIDMKLLGISTQGLMKEGTLASLWSGMKRITRLGIQPTLRLRDQILSLIPSVLRSDVTSALDGDQDAQSRLDARGPWETVALGIDAASPAYSGDREHRIR